MHLMSLALQVDTILHVTAEFSFELLKKFKPSIKKKKNQPVLHGNLTEIYCKIIFIIKISSALPKKQLLDLFGVYFLFLYKFYIYS